MQNDSLAHPVAGGLLTLTSPDGVTSQPSPFEVWLRPADGELPAETWVVLSPPGSESVRLNSAALKVLKHRVDAHSAIPTVEQVGVRVSDGALSMTVQQEWPLGATLAVSLLSLAIGAVIVATLRIRRRSAALLRLVQHESESREAERTRVSREIHDGPLQDLALLARLDATPLSLQNTLRAVSTELRSLAAGLRPPALDRFGLLPALHDLAERWASRLVVSVRAEDGIERLPPDTELVVYRVVQEALTNAAGHGRASTAWVFVRPFPDRTDFVVRDDGDGPAHVWDPAGADASRLIAAQHFGLVGMAERARSIGASLSFGRGPGDSGAEIVLSIPRTS